MLFEPAMAAPPRPPSPDSLAPALPRSGYALQISPNLEALLEHDELTRRNSSPTNTFYTTNSAEFAISLPPPPPRKVNGGRKEIIPTTRSKKKPSSDQRPDVPSDSRPVTPNPYLNPAPIWEPQTQRILDDVQTPTQANLTLTIEPNVTSDRRPSPASKGDKFRWIGRDSLNLFSASGSKRADSDRRNDRTGCDLDAVQDRQIRQTPVPPPRPSSDNDTATSPATFSPLQQSSHSEHLETASARSYSIYSEASTANDTTLAPQRAHLQPRLSLPLPPMAHDASRPKSVDGVTGHDYLSFIDFFSQSTSDLCNTQDTASVRRQPHSISIPPSSIYSTSSYNHSSISLASMRFAPPSPTPLTVQPSPVCSPSDSVSSVALSSMVFAPPSPASDHVNHAWLHPCPSPPSPYSPLEFAPPPGSPLGVIDKPSPPLASELVFERGRRFKSGKRSISLSPRPIHHVLSSLPPTTNELGANERADRVRRNRKLTRVFGRTPGTDEVVTDVESPRVLKKSHSPSLAGLLTKQKSHRHAVSVSVAVKSPVMKTEPCSPWQTDGLLSPDGRRHSIPLTPGSFTFYMDDEQGAKKAKNPHRPRNIVDSPETASTRSFIDLSDEDSREGDNVSGLSFLAPFHLRHRRLHQSNSTPSLVDSFDSEAQAEADKRRKREKMAKLHRFLGSRVPPEAIVGNVCGVPLPPATVPEEPDREHRVRGHKNMPSDDFDRGKEELDGKEKAINVRRAQKMERVFGMPPPQTLFHTRHTRPTVPNSQPTSPINVNPYVLTLDLPSTSRNPNQSAYVGKTPHRRGPSDSSRCLLPPTEDTPQPSPSSFAHSFAESFADSLTGYQQVLAQSTVYLNYQHSLNSLVDIIDRDDRQSLVELHRFLHGEVGESPSEDDVTVNSRRGSIAASLKSERRHSLPSKASMSSLSSEFLTSPRVSRFQIRRRKAAKLTNFFGVDYHELIHDILESIEKGVDEECKRGTLQPQEVEVLMHRVRSLRTMRDPFPR